MAHGTLLATLATLGWLAEWFLTQRNQREQRTERAEKAATRMKLFMLGRLVFGKPERLGIDGGMFFNAEISEGAEKRERGTKPQMNTDDTDERMACFGRS